VIFSAIVLALLSLLQLLMALGVEFGATMESRMQSSGVPGGATAVPVPAWMPFFLYGFCGVLIAFGAWGILTVVGLVRLRRWARYSMLIIGGGLAVIGLFSLPIMLVMAFLPLPVPPGVDASQAQSVHTMTRVALGFVSLFYLLILAIGVSWLIYFNRKKVREVFISPPGRVVAESPRPILISVIAVLLMVGGVSCLLMAFLPLPLVFLGLALRGWGKVAMCVGYGAVLGAAGVGLWKLKEWGRRLALGLQAFGLAQYIVYLVRPSLMTRYMDEINRAMGITQPQFPAQIQSMQSTMIGVSFGIGIVFLIAIAWILHRDRGAFKGPTAQLQPKPAALP
jgi:uncharacterized membrane protein (DUF2068 family)